MDLRCAARTLARRPWFALTVIGVLALGIGPSVAIFTLIDALLLRPLPYADPDGLVELADIYEGEAYGVGQSEFRDWSRDATAFEGLALAESVDAVIAHEGQTAAERIQGARVSGTFFDVLGVAPLRGRTFQPDEDSPGAARVVVLTHALWQRRFGGRSDVVGATVRLDHEPHTVLGVMPADFFWVGARDAQFYRPLGYRSSGRGQHQYDAVGRLADGVSLADAQSQMDVFARRAEQQYAQAAGWSVRISPLGGVQAQRSRSPLLFLAGAVGLVQLLVCANVGGLMLVNATSRSEEIVVRAALGARPLRLVRQISMECGLLGIAGAGAGLLLAAALLRAAHGLMPPEAGLPDQGLAIDARALAFSVLLLIASTILFALVPARRVLRQSLSCGLRSGLTEKARRSPLAAVVILEVGIAASLLVGAGLLLMSLDRLLREDLGFRHESVLTMEVLPPAGLASPSQRTELFASFIDEVARQPGVRSVAATSALPTSGVHTGMGFDIEGRPPPEEWRQQSARWCAVTLGYFRTLGMTLLQGRDLLASDTAGSLGVAIISESLAQRHWPGGNPVGRRIRLGGNDPWLTIVGVVSDTRYEGPGRRELPTMYVPYAQSSSRWPWTMFVAARIEARPEPIVASIRAAARRIGAEVPLNRLAFMDERIADTLAVERAVASTLLAFATLAVVLSTVGLYGVVARSVALRTPELGLRLALGATRRQLIRMVMGGALVMSLAGATWGLLLAAVVVRGLGALLYEIEPLHPVIFVAVPLFLAVIALLASYVPARRAASVDPMQALRAR